MRTKRLLIGIPLAIGGLLFTWGLLIYLENKRNPIHPPQIRWIMRNNTNIPVGISVNDAPYPVMRPNDERAFLDYAPDADLIVRAYEFVPGEGTDYGWHDFSNGSTVIGEISSNLVSCKSYHNNSDANEIIITIQLKVEC